jgi:hypothetical protein
MQYWSDVDIFLLESLQAPARARSYKPAGGSNAR